MTFLADMGVSMTTVGTLRLFGQDVVHLSEPGLFRMADEDMLPRHVFEQRIVLTFDLDFGEIMAASRGNSFSVVLFRLRNPRPAVVTPSFCGS